VLAFRAASASAAEAMEERLARLEVQMGHALAMLERIVEATCNGDQGHRSAGGRNAASIVAKPHAAAVPTLHSRNLASANALVVRDCFSTFQAHLRAIVLMMTKP